jgi:hypothetical protein
MRMFGSDFYKRWMDRRTFVRDDLIKDLALRAVATSKVCWQKQQQQQQ